MSRYVATSQREAADTLDGQQHPEGWPPQSSPKTQAPRLGGAASRATPSAAEGSSGRGCQPDGRGRLGAGTSGCRSHLVPLSSCPWTAQAFRTGPCRWAAASQGPQASQDSGGGAAQRRGGGGLAPSGAQKGAPCARLQVLLPAGARASGGQGVKAGNKRPKGSQGFGLVFRVLWNKTSS